MGFRSTFTTFDYGIQWPEWFRSKYSGAIWFGEDGTQLCSKREAKVYRQWAELHQDIQRAIDWDDLRVPFVLVYLHECGGVTRCRIEKDAITWSEPASWDVTAGVAHYYCSGCDGAR